MTAGASAADETVADLDTEYQAAVRVNDALTMDRILHDDFILVLGNGKSCTKSDLLADARSPAPRKWAPGATLLWSPQNSG